MIVLLILLMLGQLAIDAQPMRLLNLRSSLDSAHYLRLIGVKGRSTFL